MRTWKTIPILLVALAPFLTGQNVTLVPDIGVAQAEYHDAMEAWLNNDRDLEKDLLTGEKEQMRRRVRKAAALRDEVMVKKQAYLDLIVLRLKETRSHLAPANASEIPVSDFRKDLEAQQARMLSDQERLNDLLKEIPEGDEYFMVRRALEAERSSLINLQNTVALRIHALDSLDKSQDAIRGASGGETEAQKLDEILKVWDEERAAATRQRSTWAGLYKTISQPFSQPKIWIQRISATGWSTLIRHASFRTSRIPVFLSRTLTRLSFLSSPYPTSKGSRANWRRRIGCAAPAATPSNSATPSSPPPSSNSSATQ